VVPYPLQILPLWTYEKRCRDFFSSYAFARAAVEMGGIIGRLAKEYLGQDVVLIGPALESEHTGYLFDGRCTQYLGDMLTDDDFSLICGTYRLETDSRKLSYLTPLNLA
jgi:hypothetical protein